MASIACCCALMGGVFVPSTARADDSGSDSDAKKDAAESAGPSGLEAGMRLGYALPMGQVSGSGTNPAMSNLYSGMVPLWFDLGYRASPHWYVGGYFQYGFASVGPLSGGAGMTGTASCSNGLSCSGSVLAGGLDAHYHFQPAETFDPWVGFGVGYEVANLSMSQGNASAGISFNGFQFLNLSLGGDLRVSRNFAVGPYALFSLGEYSSCGFSDAATALGTCSVPQTALHQWLSFGLRATFDTGS
jgi:outer membrane protein